MQKKNKLSASIKALIVGAIIAGAGILIGLIAFLVVGFKVENFATNLVQTKEQIITEEFSNIDIASISADISVFPSEDDDIKIAYTEDKRTKYNLEIKDGTLFLIPEKPPINNILDLINVNIIEDYVDLYLPEKMFENLGDITLKVTTGDLSWVNCPTNAKSLTLTSTTGDMFIHNIRVDGKIKSETTTGEVQFIGVDAKEFDIDVTTGNVFVSLFTPKDYKVKTTTGNYKVPEEKGTDIFKCNTTTGNITVKVNPIYDAWENPYENFDEYEKADKEEK